MRIKCARSKFLEDCFTVQKEGRERGGGETDRDRQTDRQTDRDRDRYRERLILKLRSVTLITKSVIGF